MDTKTTQFQLAFGIYIVYSQFFSSLSIYLFSFFSLSLSLSLSLECVSACVGLDRRVCCLHSHVIKMVKCTSKQVAGGD